MRKNVGKNVSGRAPTGAAEEELRRKVAVSLADRRKNVPASKVFKRLRALRSATER